MRCTDLIRKFEISHQTSPQIKMTSKSDRKDNNSIFRIYATSILGFLLFIQVVYILQINFFFINAKYLSPAIFLPIFVGLVFGTIIGRLRELRLRLNKQKQIEDSLATENILNRILIQSTHELKLERYLESILPNILNAEFVKVESQIGIFLKDPDGKFRIKAQKNLHEKIIENCAIKGISSGECLCGIAIQKKQTIQATCVDEKHTISFEGMADHGHYNVPIIFNNEVLGVIVLYLTVGHERNKKEVEFLESIANILALVIHKFQLEQLKNKEVNQLNFELRKRNLVLSKKNEELDNFVYSTSHDLRSPLLSILGLVNLLKKEETDINQRLHILDLMEKGLHKTDSTIRNILEYSRNEKLDLDYQEINIHELISEIIDSHKHIDGEEINILTDISVKKIISDLNRIKIVLNNLISNAIKYRRKDIRTEILVSFSQINDDYFLLRVKDNGEGIDSENLDKIFQMFHRASSKSQGTGLGLYITKEIITKLNAEIEVTSEKNKGSEFLVKIPTKV